MTIPVWSVVVSGAGAILSFVAAWYATFKRSETSERSHDLETLRLIIKEKNGDIEHLRARVKRQEEKVQAYRRWLYARKGGPEQEEIERGL